MIKTMARKLAESAKEHGWTPGIGTHISTYPLMKAGGSLIPKAPKEADSGSSNPAQLRDDQSIHIERAAHSAGGMKINSHFRESMTVLQNSTKYKVTLIQEGLGNLRDCFYYTKGALQGATSLFEGKKCYADHPTQIDEQIRPERSTRDILGHFENVQYEEDDQGRGQLVADLYTVHDTSASWARALLSTSLDYSKKYPDSEFVGLSINASGEANEMPMADFLRETDVPSSVLPKLQQAQAEGISVIRVVNQLKDAVSCDLVTEAGAGGKILQMIEQEKKPMKKIKEAKEEGMEKKEKKEADMEKKEAAPADGPASAEPAASAHDDEAQDKELFAKMIKQYLGDDMGDDAGAKEMAQHAYEACKEDGMEHEAAYEAAGKHLAMAMKVGKKMGQKEKAHEGEEGKGVPAQVAAAEALPAPAGDDHDDDDAPAPAPVMKKKECSHKVELAATKAKLVAALGRESKLLEADKKRELVDYLDKKLSESKQEKSVTNRFRESLGVVKSKEQIDTLYKVFMAGAEVAGAVGSDDIGFSFLEKTSFTQSESVGTVGSFGDCLE